MLCWQSQSGPHGQRSLNDTSYHVPLCLVILYESRTAGGKYDSIVKQGRFGLGSAKTMDGKKNNRIEERVIGRACQPPGFPCLVLADSISGPLARKVPRNSQRSYQPQLRIGRKGTMKNDYFERILSSYLLDRNLGLIPKFCSGLRSGGEIEVGNPPLSITRDLQCQDQYSSPFSSSQPLLAR